MRHDNLDSILEALAESKQPADIGPEARCLQVGQSSVRVEDGRIVLQCGRASIVMHADGRIVLRADSIVSDAEGVNRVSGGQIELN